MPKKKRKVAKTGPVWKQTAEEVTRAQMPRYNAFACGHGPHGSAKYDRAKSKRDWKRQIGNEGASRGSFGLSWGITRPALYSRTNVL